MPPLSEAGIIGALRTRDVLALALDAEDAGAAGLLLAPVSYQPLKDHEVQALFETVCAAVRTPICVYDNPGTTHFRFTDALHGRIAALPNIASIKIPRLADDPVEVAARVAPLRPCVPAHVTLGVSGDASAVRGLLAGCDGWYSVGTPCCHSRHGLRGGPAGAVRRELPAAAVAGAARW